MSKSLRPLVGGCREPFWRHFNSEEWEPEWRTLVDVLEHDYISTDWRRAVENLRRGVEEKSENARLLAYKEWLGHLELLRRHERSEQLCAVLREVLDQDARDIVQHFVDVVTSKEITVVEIEETRLCLRALRGMCLFVPALCDYFVDENMERLLVRLQNDSEDSKIRTEVLELLLVVVADSQTRQRDFMRRSGIQTICALYTSEESTSELADHTKAFIGVIIRYILPTGTSAALSNALTAEARESVEEAIGADSLLAAMAFAESLAVGLV